MGRGLRRTAYDTNEDGLFEAEYVNIFGVPFTFLPHEGGEDGKPPHPSKPKTLIEPLLEKQSFEIRFPNVIRIEHVFKPLLTLDPGQVEPLELNVAHTPTIADLAPVVEGKPDITKITEIDLEKLAKENRTQRIIFTTARDIFDQMKPQWKGHKEFLLAQLISIVEKFIRSDRIVINPPIFDQDALRRRLIITLNMTKIIQHLWEAIRFSNSERIVPVFDRDFPVKSTGDMRPWYTGKPCEYTKRSHINFCGTGQRVGGYGSLYSGS